MLSQGDNSTDEEKDPDNVNEPVEIQDTTGALETYYQTTRALIPFNICYSDDKNSLRNVAYYWSK